MMKKITSLIIVLSLLTATLLCFDVGSALAATSGNCGENGSNKATWSYDEDTTTLTISGTGATNDYNALKTGRVPWYDYKTSITKVVVEEGITTLGQCIFYASTALESVSLPTTLTTISGGINLGSFRECTALTSITMPVNLTTIGAYAFKGCTSLATVNLNDNLTSIGTYAFNGCSALKSITFPDSLTSLGNYAFTECTSLKTVTYGTGMTSTGAYAFYNAGVSKINFSSVITEVSEYSFYGTSLLTVELPETIESIGTRAFANCTSLQSATIYNANCSFNGLASDPDPFKGSQQSLVMKGHSGSTTQTYAESKGYTFESIDDCEHTSTHEVVTLEPTCTETGTTTQVCDDCGFVVSTTELAANGHTYVTTETVDNTETDGHTYEYQTCSVCSNENTVITHNAYVEGYYTYTNTATCTSTGIETKKCNVDGCGQTERSIAQKTGHTIESPTVTKEATCTETGTQTGTCSVCNEEVTETIPATGHTFSDESETLDNTETDGHTYLVQTCTVCNETVTTPTHVEWVDGNYTSVVLVEAQCVINGQQRDTCSICGETRLVTLEANGEHVWTETTRTEPTCTAVGKIYYKCENCTLTKSENIEALGHDYEITASEAPTCTGAGYNKYKCTRDGCSATTTETVSATGHTPDESTYVVTSEATCTEDGSAEATCSVCGEEYEITLAATGHNYETVSVEIEDKPGHTLDTPTCTVCSATQASSTVHQEWIEGYYTSEVETEGDCVTDRVVVDTCSICSETRENVTEAVGSHTYSYSGLSSENKLIYDCSVCGSQYTVRPTVVSAFWNVQYVNKAPADITNGYLLELNKDGVINAKDYALLQKAVSTNSSSSTS